ncbi:pyridoxamine 5'-phosphate oxidase family protein [Aestuariirhabdus sp. Z084]|uniref:HugZ family pyridoxamine 5'-phosphate oxidase n=1 Tax=Aestuariirhabdus haliotis TaxID=2918751 RepID=UPI00201B44B7|nr:pyridoxamine 5'-phosphate oxidase family protein [Aestuariirhabdus haliotis]MCL6416157.1 pyridoxamine 5'-phosphate oxidase family protein [Aestuariirhabdus haliotis]MCL6420086.1 pyridoxamine 5'-phosphate oxidase family protein [Aestuariirhabdus haliotis]
MTGVAEQLNHFLASRNSLMLATVDTDGKPLSSYAPCCLNEGAFYVFLSELAPHTGNLLANEQLSLLLIEDQADCSNAFRRQRLSCTARATRIERTDSRWHQITDQLEQELGGTMPVLKQLPDFHLFRITPDQGTFICGFGRAYRLQGLDVNSLTLIEGQ